MADTTTTTSSSDAIVFYDIASGPRSTRYALNFKRAHFVTQWVDLADVTSTRKSLGAEPVRFHPNGEHFYTLPAIRDPSANDTVVADSFDIAVYLDKKYPDAPSLFRNNASSGIGLYASFNAHMDTIFTPGAALGCEDFPFNPATAAQCQAEFCRRIGAQTWDALFVRGEARTKMLKSFRTSLGEVAKYFRFSEGPFIGGKEAEYADIIIGGWLMMYSHTVPEWEEMRTWHGGFGAGCMMRWSRIEEHGDAYN
ncbi:hypothetical protein PG997_006423 [Apiospora hydei]|uniref:GST N-terminal domain-containing protein n=1 Tax=Apiospora hydei TaxID=1337664 RepID=A0ABR1WNV0_9PEZI